MRGLALISTAMIAAGMDHLCQANPPAGAGSPDLLSPQWLVTTGVDVASGVRCGRSLGGCLWIPGRAQRCCTGPFFSARGRRGRPW